MSFAEKKPSMTSKLKSKLSFRPPVTQDPRTFSRTTKGIILMCIGLCASTSGFSSTIYFPGNYCQRARSVTIYNTKRTIPQDSLLLPKNCMHRLSLQHWQQHCLSCSWALLLCFGHPSLIACMCVVYCCSFQWLCLPPHRLVLPLLTIFGDWLCWDVFRLLDPLADNLSALVSLL